MNDTTFSFGDTAQFVEDMSVTLKFAAAIGYSTIWAIIFNLAS